MNWKQLVRHALGAVATGLAVTFAPDVTPTAADPGTLTGVGVLAYALTEKLLKGFTGEPKDPK